MKTENQNCGPIYIHTPEGTYLIVDVAGKIIDTVATLEQAKMAVKR